ncbi:MAG: hypothetical protein Q7V31_11980 [Parvibaculum sp.]|uniref:hypothetical protein n=1 Tax=Parvibaculum sp. TaxID=2024848 RepID=UPI002720A35A|nr:hypothetical protein [Parvibaculum sp.]MDO8839637.1 hypothetical protein [Parvibaculum sp.]
MTVEKLFPSGDWLVSDIVAGQYEKQRYSGYTKREAVAAFRDYVREQRAKIIREVRPRAE